MYMVIDGNNNNDDNTDRGLPGDLHSLDSFLCFFIDITQLARFNENTDEQGVGELA